MWRVLADFVRQTRWIWLVNAGVYAAGFLWLLHVVRPAHAGIALNLGGLVADLMSFAVVTTVLDAIRMTRALAPLPIRRRDLGAGLWLVGVVGPAMLTLAVKMLVVVVTRVTSPVAPATLGWVMTSTPFDVAYAGTLAWIMTLEVGRHAPSRIPAWLKQAAWTAAAVAFAGGTFALALYMPTSLVDWHWASGLALVGMLALTRVGYTQSERLVVYGGTAALLFGGGARGAEDAGGAKGAKGMPFSNRLSGPRRMLWQQFRGATITAAVTLSVLILMNALPFSKTLSTWDHLRQTLIEMQEEVGGMLWGLLWVMSTLVGMKRWHPSRLRPMRLLPISAGELNALLFFRPVVTWLGFWLVLLAIYGFAPGPAPAWWGVGGLVAATGACALMSAAMWRWEASPLMTFVPTVINYSLIWGHPWKYLPAGVFGGRLGQVVAVAIGTAVGLVAFRWQARLLGQPRATRGVL